VVICRCSLAQPHTGLKQVSRGSLQGAYRNDARRSRSAKAAGHDDASRGGGLPSSTTHGDVKNNGSCHGFSATGATSNIAPVAVDAVNLDTDSGENKSTLGWPKIN